ncbi:hypothetical protein DYQ86_07450 [Acidobacteria bacterium AB60]|nr:hypothetical protein DYQ86_07450 [Acidobacteria bacterium AB60]
MQGLKVEERLGKTVRALGLFLTFMGAAGCAFGVAPGVAGPKTTLVVFSDRPLAGPAWSGLFAELRREATAESRSFPILDPDPEVVRGLDVVAGQLTENPIVVKLHGDCNAPVGVRSFPSDAPLGWVRREEGRISSFIQVDCTRVAQLISPRLLWMSAGQKAAAMSGAIARVILHEWIHIAEQTDHHGRRGITKPQFGGEDLLDGFESEIGVLSPGGGKGAGKSQPN